MIQSLYTNLWLCLVSLLCFTAMPASSVSGQCANTVNSFPYAQSFEGGGVGDWQQGTNDDDDWTNNTGSTSSGSTGPSGASDGNNYMYTETSSPVDTGDVFHLESPCFDMTGGGLCTASFTFDFHMFDGDQGDMGTLKLQVEAPSGSGNWTDLWSRTGNQGDQWLTGSVDLGSFVGQNIRLRFEMTVGLSTPTFRNDAAVDNLRFNNFAATNQSVQICDNESFTVGTNTYTTAGTFVDTLTSAGSCDSVVTTNLTVFPTFQDTLNVGLCPGDTLFVGSSAYTTAGTFQDTLSSFRGCDSVVVSNVSNVFPATDTQTVSLCQGDTAVVELDQENNADGFEGNSFDQSLWADTTNVILQSCQVNSGNQAAQFDEDTRTLETTTKDLRLTSEVNFCFYYTDGADGCPGAGNDPSGGDELILQYSTDGGASWVDIRTYDVTTFPTLTWHCVTEPLPMAAQSASTKLRWFQDPSVDAEDVYLDDVSFLGPIETVAYSSQGTFLDTLTAANGCDSILTTIVDTVFPAPTDTVNATICAGDTLFVGGTARTTAGTFVDSVGIGPSPNGCDSLQLTNLTVVPADRDTQNLTVCEGDSFSVGPNTRVAEFAIDGFENGSFDTSVWADTTNAIIQSCNVFEGNNAVQFDIDTRTLETVNQDLSGFPTVDFCFYYTDGADGCPGAGNDPDGGEELILQYSTDGGATWIDIRTYDLTTFPTLTWHCVSEPLPMAARTSSAKLRWFQDPFLDTEDVYLDNIGIPATFNDTLTSNTTGCDSIITTTLEINPTFQDTQNVTFCDGDTLFVGSSAYTSTGTFTDTLATGAGCDSVIVSNLNVLPNAADTQNFSLCQGDSVVVDVGGGEITDNFDGGFDPNLWVNVNNEAFQATVCGATTQGDAIFFDGGTGSADRFIESTDLDLSTCSQIEFELLLPTNSGGCNAPETNDAIELQYSTDGGAAWTTIQSYTNTTGNFVSQQEPIPSGALTPATRLRFVQPNFSGGTNDNWALDEVAITGCQATSVYKTQGAFIDTLTATNGCDSILTTVIDTVFSAPIDTVMATICEGDTLFVGDTAYTTSGSFLDSVGIGPSPNGCDSLQRTNLTVLPENVSQNLAVCEGDSFTVDSTGRVAGGISSEGFESGNFDPSLWVDTTGVIVQNCQVNTGNWAAQMDAGTRTLEMAPQNWVATDTVNFCFYYTDGADTCPGAGNGPDAGDELILQYSTDGGNTWVDIFTYGLGTFPSLTWHCVETALPFAAQTDSTQLRWFQDPNSGTEDVYIDNIGIPVTFVDTLTNFLGCDSIVTTSLDISPTFQDTQNVDVCDGDTLFVGSSAYTTAGTFVDTLASMAGCDSVVVSNVNILPNAADTQTVSLCQGDSVIVDLDPMLVSDGFEGATFDPALWADNTNVILQSCQVNSGNQAAQFDEDTRTLATTPQKLSLTNEVNFCFYYTDGADGCPGAGNVPDNGEELILQYSTDGGNTWVDIRTYDLATFPSLTWHCVSEPLPMAAQTDSTQLRWFQDPFLDTEDVYLDDVSFLGPRATVAYSSKGTFMDTLTAANGCDSVLTTVVDTLFPAAIDTVNATICEGDTFFVGSNAYTISGTFVDSIGPGSAPNFCDSAQVTVLNVIPTKRDTLDVTTCAGDSVFVGPNKHVAGGFTTDGFEDGNFDSNVWANTPNARIQDCRANTGNNSVQFNGSAMERSIETVPYDWSGNDSVSFCFFYSDFGDVCPGGGDAPEGGDELLLEYSTDGGATWNTIRTYDLATFPTVTWHCVNEALPMAAQGPNTKLRWVQDPTFDDETVYLDNVEVPAIQFVDTLVAPSTGCDSVVTTNLMPVQGGSCNNQIASICDGDTFFVDTIPHTTAGIFTDTLTNMSGNDSIVVTDLSVLPNAATSQTVSLCAGDTLFVGNIPHDTAGTFMDTLTAVNGCDSVVTSTVSILPNVSDSQAVKICEGETFMVGPSTYDSTGVFVDVFSTVDGCDSTITTNLTVVDTALMQIGTDTLVVSSQADSIVWINCATGQAVPGENSPVFAPDSSGTFQAQIFAGSCMHTTGCVNVSITNRSPAKAAFNNLKVFPNPTEKHLDVRFDRSVEDLTLRLFDMNGRKVAEKFVGRSDRASLDFDLPGGVYTLEVDAENGRHHEKIVIR